MLIYQTRVLFRVNRPIICSTHVVVSELQALMTIMTQQQYVILQ